MYPCSMHGGIRNWYDNTHTDIYTYIKIDSVYALPSVGHQQKSSVYHLGRFTPAASESTRTYLSPICFFGFLFLSDVIRTDIEMKHV